MKSFNKLFYTFLLIPALFIGCNSNKTKTEEKSTKDLISNPIIADYYADPSIVYYEGKYYIYATIDPWGGEELGVLVTSDFKNFEKKHINWPTKKACTSPTSKTANVWAPSVVQTKDGKFYMFVSVGNEIWVGTADNPLGPWANAKEDSTPLINAEYFPGYHMIDAECFIDDDQQAYLYWGSGWNWINGKCFAAPLNKDMKSFKEDPKDVTPPNYFEAPVMMKRNNIYYLLYSNGKAIDATYNVRYATANNPMGPFTEGKNSPILKTSADSSTIGPGHNTVFSVNGQSYILYHRIFPQKEDYVLRQLCIDSLNFDADNNIKTVVPKGVVSFISQQ